MIKMTAGVFPNRFARALADIREAHALPREKAQTLDESRLLLKVLQIDDITDRSFKLNHLRTQEQQAIYGLYLLTGVPEELRLIDELVIRYASWSLFTSGWTLFQLHFPNQVIQRSLAWLWRYLTSSEYKVGPKPPFFLQMLPDALSLRLSSAELLTSTLALLTTETTREHKPLTVSQFLIRRHILLEGRFAAMLLELWLRQQNDNKLIEHLALLRKSWPSLPAQELGTLLKRVLNSSDLEEAQRTTLLHNIDDVLDEAHDDKSDKRRQLILEALSPTDRDVWHAWKILDALKNQYRAYPAKRKFMLQFLPRIRSFTKLDSTTIAWEFPGFILVDSILAAEHSYIYTEEHYQAALSASPSVVGDLGEPLIPFRSIDYPQDDVKKNSIYQIHYVEPMLSRAGDFIYLKLGLRPRSNR